MGEGAVMAERIIPSDSHKWFPVLAPVVDGPHRKFWREAFDRQMRAMLAGKWSGRWQDWGRSTPAKRQGGVHEEDIDANGWYSNVRRELEDCR